MKPQPKSDKEVCPGKAATAISVAVFPGHGFIGPYVVGRIRRLPKSTPPDASDLSTYSVRTLRKNPSSGTTDRNIYKPDIYTPTQPAFKEKYESPEHFTERLSTCFQQ